MALLDDEVRNPRLSSAVVEALAKLDIDESDDNTSDLGDERGCVGAGQVEDKQVPVPDRVVPSEDRRTAQAFQEGGDGRPVVCPSRAYEAWSGSRHEERSLRRVIAVGRG